MKTCPYCAEDIADKAIKCKHCGENLEEPKSSDPIYGTGDANITSKKNPRLKAGGIILALVVLWYFGIYSEDSNIALENNNKGVDYVEQGNYEQGLKYIDDALESDPTDSLFLANKCYVEYSLGNYEDSISFCNQALDNKPNKEQKGAIFNNLCLVYDDLGQYDLALDYCNKSIDIVEDALGLSNKCLVQYHLEEYTEALINCNNALELDPNLPEGLNNMGLLVSNYDPEESLIYYDKSLKQDPLDGVTLINKSLSLLELERYEDVIITMSDLHEADPSYYQRGSILCYAQFFLENYFMAIENADEYLLNNEMSDDQESYEYTLLCKALALSMEEELLEAEALVDQILQINPNNEEALEIKEMFDEEE